MPVGPGAAELHRLYDLLDSLWRYEQGARLCVLIDTWRRVRTNVLRRKCPQACRFAILDAPFSEQGEALFGRLSANLLLGYRAIHAAGPFEFVLRLDTDALIIGPFHQSVRDFLACHPETGMLGTVGHTCRHESPYYGSEETSVSDVFTALETSPGATRIARHAELAVQHGYAGKEYCQGGAYLLPFRMLEKMCAAGCLDSPEDWLPLAVPEDVMMGMYCRTVGLRSVDFSLPGQPFGNHYRGLPYTPRELVRRGYSIIHSVKSDPLFSERFIRRYFRSRRDFISGTNSRNTRGAPFVSPSRYSGAPSPKRDAA